MTEAVTDARVEGSGNIIVQAVGSGITVSINPNVPHLRLTRFEARTKLVSRTAADTALLSAYRSDVVPLLGRESVLGELWDWMKRDRIVTLRVMIGAGGRGKTRLALELAREAMAEGWLAGFVEKRELDRFRAQQNLSEWGWDKPTLVVVDYAASRADQLRDWLGELVDAAMEAGRPRLRMLLLERQAQREIGWLALVVGHGADDRSRAVVELLDPAEPLELPVIDDLASRRQIFTALLERKRPELTAPALGADPEFDRLLREEKWAGDPLFLMMAGLVAAEVGVKDALTLTRADLATNVAQRELDRIGGISAGAGIDANRRYRGLLARHVAVLATLAQGLSLGDARQLLEEEKGRLNSSADVNATLEALRDALPAGSEGGEIAPILPDMVGEAAILVWLGRGGVLPALGIEAQSCIGRMAGTVLDRVSQIVVRTAQDFAAAGHDEPVRWLDALAQASEADVGALMQIADQLPAETPVLRELAVALTRRIVDRLRTLAGSELERPGVVNAALHLLALSLNNLGARLSDLGRHEEALTATQEAVDIRRRLAAARPDALAGSLNDLGARLGNLGRPKEALAAAQEAVDIYRRLAAARPDALLPDLATSLNSLGNSLGNLGRREEALTATQEAVDIYRRLAAARPDAFRPNLAGLLNNLGARLSNLGRREEALTATQAGVDIYRRLAAARPDGFLPDLATSLANLGNGLNDLGRREEALVAAQEAADIYRRLAAAHPDAFLPDLAGALTNLGARLNGLGRWEEALAATQEAVDIHRRLAAARPDAFLPDLAASLNNLGNGLSDLGRREEALAATQEAVDIRHRLAAARPDAFLPDLAGSLQNLGNRLGNLGRREEALIATQEAVDICRRLAAARPDAFLPDLATSLNSLGNRLSDLGRREEALAATQEAVEIYRRLAAARPDAYRPYLAGSLNNLGNGLSNLGRREEALAATQEGVDIYRRLAAARPDASLPDLAGLLTNLSARLSNLGRREEVLAAAQEAVDIYRRLAAARPDAFLPYLAGSITNLGNNLSDLGRHEGALGAAEEAVRLYRALADARPEAFTPDLARSLDTLAAMLSALGRREEALAAAEEAVRLCRVLAEARPDAFMPTRRIAQQRRRYVGRSRPARGGSGRS